jgi:hypothetical protein
VVALREGRHATFVAVMLVYIEKIPAKLDLAGTLCHYLSLPQPFSFQLSPDYYNV